MILSASRRTDIPNYYSDWFLNRIREGYLYVRNPMNAHQVSRIALSPELVDCIVFWTKNPRSMLEKLDELEAFHYYFQFTLTGFGNEVECYVPHKRKVVIPVFQRLAHKIGKERVIWRYDPIFFTGRYDPDYHLRAFGQIAEALQGCTKKCVISFGDVYAKNKKRMEILRPYFLREDELKVFARELAVTAEKYGIEVATCAETIDLSHVGIGHNCCIDKSLIEKIIGCRIKADKDKNQRKECGCIESVEIGTYNTCKNDCMYCYANFSRERVLETCRKYDEGAPLLCGEISEGDSITERKIKSLKEGQMALWDF